MQEVVQLATELYTQDQNQLQTQEEQRATLEAASEVGLPAEYLERAASLVHQRRAERILAKRRRARGLLATVGVALALCGGWAVLHPPPPKPLVYTFNAAPERQWVLNASPGSQATLTFGSEAGQAGVAVVRVERFDPSRTGTYFVNLDTSDVPRSLAGYRTVSFRVRGQGLPRIRLYLDASPTERWRSPALPVSGEWQEHRLRLEQFDHQSRATPSDRWRRESYRAPGAVERLSFKLGDYVNDASASGEVAVDDLRFEP
jgi:hypothetical protein